jgi:hypothetical protein
MRAFSLGFRRFETPRTLESTGEAPPRHQSYARAPAISRLRSRLLAADHVTTRAFTPYRRKRGRYGSGFHFTKRSQSHVVLVSLMDQKEHLQGNVSTPTRTFTGVVRIQNQVAPRPSMTLRFSQGPYDLWSLQGPNPDQGERSTPLHPPRGVSAVSEGTLWSRPV